MVLYIKTSEGYTYQAGEFISKKYSSTLKTLIDDDTMTIKKKIDKLQITNHQQKHDFEQKQLNGTNLSSRFLLSFQSIM